MLKEKDGMYENILKMSFAFAAISAPSEVRFLLSLSRCALAGS